MSISAGDRSHGGAHVLLFPLQGSGHIIPTLDFAHQLLLRGLNVTVIVAPANLPLVQDQIQSRLTSLQPLVLSFPEPLAPSMAAVIRATSELYGPLLEWFKSHPSPPVAIISDFFLGWTQKLASEIGIPRLVFWASGVLSSLILNPIMGNIGAYVNVGDENTLFSFPNIPNSPEYTSREIALCTAQFRGGESDSEFMRESLLINNRSWGAVFNSFADLEGIYVDAVKKEMGHNRVWAVGPLLPSRDDHSAALRRGGRSGGGESTQSHRILNWLDGKVDDSVLYICFGSRVGLTGGQSESIAAALERSGVDFIWCVKTADCGLIPAGFEDRVAGKGFLIKGWAPQVSILRHPAVGAFLSHCGWNSVLEGIANGVTMLTWPVDGDQLVNAKLLVDELGVAVGGCEGGTGTVPDACKLAEIFAQSVGSDHHPEKDRVRRLRDAAAKAVADNGSSSTDLDSLVHQLNELTRKD